MTETLGFLSLVGAAFALVFGAARLVGGVRTRARLRARLESFAGLSPANESDGGGGQETAVRDTRGAGPLRRALEARYPLTGPRAGGLGFLAAAALAVGVAAAASFFGVPTPIAVAGGIGSGAVGGLSVAGLLEGRRRLAFEQAFLVAIDDFQRMVHFGIGSQQAFAAIASAAQEPLRGALRNVAHAADLGVEMAAAMEAEARRIRIGELAMLAAILATQARGGGNLSEAVANLAAMLRERLDNRMRLRAMTAESRITLIILSLVRSSRSAYRPPCSQIWSASCSAKGGTCSGSASG